MEQGLSSLKAFVKENKSNLIVLADKHTLKDCYPLLEEELPHFIVPYGEGYKNLNSCEFIWKKLTDLNASRSSILLCLGGGVLCDMGAFAAGCYQRGIKTALVPTSLLAMVDASAGGKNGVNFLGFKNYIGTFKEPDSIFICHEFLNTLPYDEKINGYVEMLKHGLIASKSHYDVVKLLFLKDREQFDNQLIYDSVKIKQQHVDLDFKDNGVRKRLNFGHTVGHAIESYSLARNMENESLSHGMSVALGIVVESYISNQLNGLNEDELKEITIVLQRIVNSINEEIPSLDVLIPYLQRDKKNNSDGINFSLLSGIGNCDHDFNVSLDIIGDGLDYLRKLK
ncbi:MAG: 3-dehydroquinate synthase [Bacteroidetes bacterium]|nr:MAG: 3-dehydroquinate synthase [Bacteroidota bacterium]